MARVVVAGAGAIGASVAYHPGLACADEVVLADLGEVAATRRPARWAGAPEFTIEAEVRLAQGSVRLFAELGALVL